METLQVGSVLAAPRRRPARGFGLRAAGCAAVAALALVGLTPAAGAAFGGLTPIELGSGDYAAGTGVDIRADGMTVGPDGALWFTEFGADKIGRRATDGTITTYPVGASGQPADIVTGPDGNLWFTQDSGNAVGRITTSGVVTMFTIAGSDPRAIHLAVGADGKIWWVNLDGNSLGRIDPLAADPGTTVTLFALPHASSQPLDIVAGPDGKLWFTEQGGRIGRIDPTAASPASTLAEFPVAAGSNPSDLAVGPDSAIWFTESDYSAHTEHLGRIEADGTITAELDVAPAGGGPTGLAVGPDGNLWFGDYISDSINRVTTAGVLTTIKLPESGKDDTEPSELLNVSGTLWVSTTHKLFIVDTTPDPTTTTTTVAGATSTTVAGATTSTVVGTAPAATPTDAQPTFTG